MSKVYSGEGVRKRHMKPRNVESEEQSDHQKKLTKNKAESKAEWKVVDWFFDVISKVIGVFFMILVSVKYGEYLEMLHESELWFTNIQEVEREISFRTEQGLYYSYYKQIVQSDSFGAGLEALLRDNKTESGRTINVLQRFNIYPEVFLALIYKSFNLQDVISPIFFYTKNIFYINGLLVGALYLTAWVLSESWLAGMLSAGLFILNLPDASRVHYTVPLRESFSGPFIFTQLAFMTLYLKHWRITVRGYLCLLLMSYFTLLFIASWQFGQFLLLLQCVVLFALTLMNVINYEQMRNIFVVNVIVMLVNFVIHHGQPMILSSLVLTFIPIALITAYLQIKVLKRIKGLCTNIVVFLIHFFGVMVFTFILNRFLKIYLALEADDHVFKFIKAKILMEQSSDFETRLYLCNKAFSYIDADTLLRLSNHLLLPVYIPTEIFLLICLILFVIARWKAQKIHGNRDNANTLFSKRPELAYWAVLSLVCGVMAFSTLRMKMLWTPQLCILASVGVVDHRLWLIVISKISSKSNVWVIRCVCIVSCMILIAAVVMKMIPIIDSQIEDLKEFWDPDTVELMEWIKTNTSTNAVFAGSMQLLAGVKLCTSRAITNHPHFEDKWLRERTKLVYQIYGKQPPERIHQILNDVQATHVILEDSICLAPSGKLCRLPDIVDIMNGHLPDSLIGKKSGPFSDLVDEVNPRFCDQVRHNKPPYSKYFKIVLSNKTFRVYQLV